MWTRARQYDRYGAEICNGRVPYELLIKTSPISDYQQQTLRDLLLKEDMSSRSHIKIIRLARTISDLSGSMHITDESIKKAIKLNRSGVTRESAII